MLIRKNVQTLAVQRGRALGVAPGSRGPVARSRLPSQHWPQESHFVIVTASASSLPSTQRGTSPKRGADSGPFLPGCVTPHCRHSVYLMIPLWSFPHTVYMPGASLEMVWILILCVGKRLPQQNSQHSGTVMCRNFRPCPVTGAGRPGRGPPAGCAGYSPSAGDPQGRVAPRGGGAGRTLSRQGSSTAGLAPSVFELLSCQLLARDWHGGGSGSAGVGPCHSSSVSCCDLSRFSSTRSCSLPSVIKGKGNSSEPRLQRSTPCSSVSWTNKMPDDADNFKV